MSNGFGEIAINLLSYPILIGSIIVVITSIVLLMLKGKQLSKYTRTFIIALLIMALFIVLYLIFMAIAFGNTPPPPSPVFIN